MKRSKSILFLLLSMATMAANASAVAELEVKLSAQSGLMMLIDNYSSEIGSPCYFSEQSSYFYEYPENVQSFVGVYRCGEGQDYPFVRIEGSIPEEGKLTLFKIVFIR